MIDAEDGYGVFNTTRLSDALDERETAFKHFRDGGIGDVERFAFDEGKLKGETIFKIPQTPEPYTLVTEPFVSAVEEAGLSGFQFRRVWP